MAFLDRSRWEGKIFTTGGWVPGSGGEYDAVEPATGTTLARVGAASEADVQRRPRPRRRPSATGPRCPTTAAPRSCAAPGTCSSSTRPRFTTG